VDMFDCVMPTRNARNGMLFTAHGTINIKNKKWENDFSPIDENGYTFVDTYYTKAYLRHLFATEEFLGKQIATLHNLGFYLWLVRQARKHILQGDFPEWKKQMVNQMNNRL
jgi:tRNA-guanine transglycosylases, various specificities